MPTTLRDVRFQGQSGKHMLLAGISPFDPFETFGIETDVQRPVPGRAPEAFPSAGLRRYDALSSAFGGYMKRREILRLVGGVAAAAWAGVARGQQGARGSGIGVF